jgi:phosphotransferase system  glucose/maltose/N-acetylglucosamine-specific IIC component
MGNIHKIPFVMGVFATIIVGMISYKTGVEYRDIYIKMLISMVAFFVVGLYLKKFIIKINEELREKEEALKEEERLKYITYYFFPGFIIYFLKQHSSFIFVYSFINFTFNNPYYFA